MPQGVDELATRATAQGVVAAQEGRDRVAVLSARLGDAHRKTQRWPQPSRCETSSAASTSSLTTRSSLLGRAAGRWGRRRSSRRSRRRARCGSAPRPRSGRPRARRRRRRSRGPDAFELLAQPGLPGDRRVGVRRQAPQHVAEPVVVEPAEQHLAVADVACSGMCWPTQLCDWSAEEPATWSRYSAELSESTAMLTVSPVSCASRRQIGRASWTTSSRAVVAPASRSRPTPRRYLPRSSVCSTRPRCSSVATSRNAVLLCTPSSPAISVTPCSPCARQELEDGQARSTDWTEPEPLPADVLLMTQR